MIKVYAIPVLMVFSFAASLTAGSTVSDSGSRKTKNVLPPIVNEKFEYYEICGSYEKDLLCDLTKKAIKCSDGKKYDSVTDWKLTWDYGYSRARRSCLMDSFRVTVDITVRMPKWTVPNDAPWQLVEKWSGYLNSLMLHEKGHRDRAVEAAIELTNAVAELRSAGTCAELDREAGALIRFHKDKLVQDQKDYDTATSHGHSEGVNFQ